MVYTNRLLKDETFAKEGSALYYVLWRHTFRCNKPLTLGALRTGLATSTRSCTILRLETFARLMREGPEMVLNATNKARGYGSTGYTHGYRLPLSKLHSRSSILIGLLSCRAYNQPIHDFEVYTEPSLRDALVNKHL